MTQARLICNLAVTQHLVGFLTWLEAELKSPREQIAAKLWRLRVESHLNSLIKASKQTKPVKRSTISWERFRGFLRDDATLCGGAANKGAKGLKFFLTEVLEANGQKDGPEIVEVMKAFIGKLNVNLPLCETHASDPACAGELLGEALEAVRKLLPAGVRVVVSLAVHEVDAGTAGDATQPSTEGLAA